VDLRIDLDQGRLVEATAAVGVRATSNGETRDAILGEFALGGAAGGTRVIGNDQPHPTDTFVRQEPAQRDRRRRMLGQIGAALNAVTCGIGRLRPANRAIAQVSLLSTAGRF
jgi:hypothetical protein